MMRAMAGLAEDDATRAGARPGLLLLIDTCGADGSIALAQLGDGTRVLRSAVMPGRSSSERLFPDLRAILAAEGRAGEEIRAIGVVRGPGSFTGIRVGVAAAKGLGEALGVRVIGLSRLAVLASVTRQKKIEAGGEEPGEQREVAALLAAGRGEFFCGRFGPEGGTAMWGALLTREAAVERCARARVVACEPAVVDALPELRVELVEWTGASAALALATNCLRRGEFDDVSTLDGYYLQRTPAEIALDRGQALAARL